MRLTRTLILANAALGVLLALLLLWRVHTLSRSSLAPQVLKPIALDEFHRPGIAREPSLRAIFGPEKNKAGKEAEKKAAEEGVQDLNAAGRSIRLEAISIVEGRKTAILLITPLQGPKGTGKGQKEPQGERHKVTEGAALLQFSVGKIESHRITLINQETREEVPLVLFKAGSMESR